MWKIKNGGLDQYGAGPFEQQQFGTAGVERVNNSCRTISLPSQLWQSIFLYFHIIACTHTHICYYSLVIYKPHCRRVTQRRSRYVCVCKYGQSLALLQVAAQFAITETRRCTWCSHRGSSLQSLSTSQSCTSGVQAATSRSSGHNSSSEQSGSARNRSLMTAATRSWGRRGIPVKPSQRYLTNAKLAAIGVLWLVIHWRRAVVCNA